MTLWRTSPFKTSRSRCCFWEIWPHGFLREALKPKPPTLSWISMDHFPRGTGDTTEALRVRAAEALDLHPCRVVLMDTETGEPMKAGELVELRKPVGRVEMFGKSPKFLSKLIRPLSAQESSAGEDGSHFGRWTGGSWAWCHSYCYPI